VKKKKKRKEPVERRPTVNKSPPTQHPHHIRWWQETLATIHHQTQQCPAIGPTLLTEELKMFPEIEEEKKTKGKGKAGGSRNGAKSAPVLTLPPERVGKLWNIMCGGQLVIELSEEAGEILCHISRNSLDSLIEGMIDKL
jgi:hypothetical protein